MKEKIIALVEEILQVPPGTVTESSQCAELEEWDSLAQVLIVGELESRFGISIPLDEAALIDGMKALLAACGE